MKDDKLLNPYQRGSVATTLTLVEMALREVLQEISAEETGILYERAGALSPEQQQAINSLVDVALADIAALADRFALPKQTTNVRATAAGRLSVVWSDLHEIRAKRLRGYGDVAPELEDVLDPSVQKLTAIIYQILTVLQGRP